MKRLLVVCLWMLMIVTALRADSAPVEQWGVFETALAGPDTGNPFRDVQLSATFSREGRDVTVTGFYDGGGTYRVRFMPDAAGAWRYATHSNQPALDGRTGTFQVVAPRPGNHGPVRVHRSFHFAYADGTPYRPVGTTAYNWLYRPEPLQDETVRTLAGSPFNKLRMLVLPSSEKAVSPSGFPFAGSPPDHWDTARFNPAFFRAMEHRVARLGAAGVEIDLILFHPYGKVAGLETMTAAEDDEYVRYVVARLAAYRNVWWSLANEFDFVRTRTDADWDRLFQLVQRCDPYGHLRSIHNGLRLYDNNKPWVTHASIQNGAAVEDSRAAELYRDVWNKPVVYDEVKYEGRIAKRWGNLTGRELVHRFWSGTVAGTYVGHSETLRTPAGTAWLSDGGTFAGESVARIAFLKRILDESPAGGIDPIDKWQDPTIGGTPGEFYLVYLGREAPAVWPFHLPRFGVVAGQGYAVEVIDTWDMTITPVEGTFTTKRQDGYTFVDAEARTVQLPGKPGMALRIRRVSGPAPDTTHTLPLEP